MKQVRLAVNGTLMRGLELNGNLLAIGATFAGEASTDAHYRLWSINDRHPAMMRVETGGTEIALELWDLPAGGVATILQQEPPGLCIGLVTLASGEAVLGVLGEPYLCARGAEITQWGGWRRYMASQKAAKQGAASHGQ